MSITIPPAALEKSAKELAAQCRCAMACDWRNHLDDARAAFLAMIKAWEGAKTIRDDGRRQTYAIPAIILPLPTENSDE